MKFEILGVFVHTLTADEQLSCSGCSEFAVLYSNAIMLKRKTFSKFFLPLMKSKSNFKQFEKKEDCHSICISEITECQRLGQTTL